MSVRVSSEIFETEVLNSEKPVLADFYSYSCVPCKRLAPVLAEIEEQHQNVKFVKININFDADLARQYEVMAAPTLILFKKTVRRLPGLPVRSKHPI